MRRWLVEAYPMYFSSIHFPQSPSTATTIPLSLQPAYILERPFVPFSISSLFHPGMKAMIARWIVSQTMIDLACVFPLWICSVENTNRFGLTKNEPENDNDNEIDIHIHIDRAQSNSIRWMSLLRHLSSTASGLLLSCQNESMKEWS